MFTRFCQRGFQCGSNMWEFQLLHMFEADLILLEGLCFLKHELWGISLPSLLPLLPESSMSPLGESPLLDISCFYSVHQTARILADFTFLSPHPESAKTTPPCPAPSRKTCPDFRLLFSQFPSHLITLLYFKYACLVAQLCPTLCDPLYCSSPGSSVHEILQARTLEWVASRGSSWPRDWTHVSCTGRQILYPLRPWGSPIWSMLLVIHLLFYL